MNKIAIFASGSGSNAENIAMYFKSSKIADVNTILTNNPKAKVIERAKKLNIDYIVFSREDFYNSNKIIDFLASRDTDFIVLAGFLWLVPGNLIEKYPNRIINIHPALLPKYGGKGMYGMRVHETVIKNKEKESGITIHYVNEKYDEGNIIFQAKCKVKLTDSAEDLANKIHKLEYKYFPEIIGQLLMNKF